jgi:hypothetical protein
MMMISRVPSPMYMPLEYPCYGGATRGFAPESGVCGERDRSLIADDHEPEPHPGSASIV